MKRRKSYKRICIILACLLLLFISFPAAVFSTAANNGSGPSRRVFTELEPRYVKDHGYDRSIYGIGDIEMPDQYDSILDVAVHSYIKVEGALTGFEMMQRSRSMKVPGESKRQAVREVVVNDENGLKDVSLIAFEALTDSACTISEKTYVRRNGEWVQVSDSSTSAGLKEQGSLVNEYEISENESTFLYAVTFLISKESSEKLTEDKEIKLFLLIGLGGSTSGTGIAPSISLGPSGTSPLARDLIIIFVAVALITGGFYLRVLMFRYAERNVKTLRTRKVTKARFEYRTGYYSGKAVTLTRKRSSCKAVVSVFDRGKETVLSDQQLDAEILDRLNEICERHHLKGLIKKLPMSETPGNRWFSITYGIDTDIASNYQDEDPEVRAVLDEVEAVIKSNIPL